MPAVASGKVLVTGATGYIASWVVKTLLDHGFSVRGTVRSIAKGVQLQKLFAEYVEYGNIFDFVVIEDMVKEGAFDDAVKGVDAIAHLASPCTVEVDDPNNLIRPAVEGTLSVLRSAAKYGTSVRRIVVTSSSAANFNEQDEFRVFNDEDWNTQALKEVEAHGRDAAPFHKYRASKTLAERAIWDFLANNEVPWDAVTINPPYAFGPSLLLSTPDRLNTSMMFWWSAVNGSRDDAFLASAGGEWLDVRDLALMHMRALQKSEAGGHRFLVSCGPYKFQEWVNIAHSLDNRLPTGNTDFDPANPHYRYRFDVSNSERILDVKCRPMEQTAKDLVEQFQEAGWIA